MRKSRRGAYKDIFDLVMVREECKACLSLTLCCQ